MPLGSSLAAIYFFYCVAWYCWFGCIKFWHLPCVSLALYMVVIKKDPFLFFHNLLKLWAIYIKFLPVVAEEILIRNIRTKCGSWLNILCQLWCNADVIMCHRYKLPASMVNLIWFAKCLSCQHWATWKHEIGCLVIQKLNHLASSVCWCTVLLEHVKDQLSPQIHKFDRFARFVAATEKLRMFDTNEPDFSPLKQGSNWQHQLGPACLYPWNIIMSALHHD